MLPSPGRASKYPLILLSSIHKRKFLRSSMLPYPKLPGELICVVIQGKGLLRIDHEVFPLQTGEAFYLDPKMRLEAILESAYVECYLLLLHRITVSRQKESWTASRTDEDASLLPHGRLHITTGQSIVEETRRLYEDSRSPSVHPAEMRLAFQSLLHSFLQPAPEEHRIEEASKGIDQSIQYMYKHFREKVKLDTLSHIAGLTQTSYSRSFKKEKGVSPVEYLNRIRIDCSKQLLRPDCSIKEVSGQVGFGNEFYFSRMFKRETGITPTLYVRRKQLRVAVATCFRYQDNLLALGVEAVAEMNGYNYAEQSESEHKRLVQTQLNALRQASPDLILADFRHMPFYEQLKQIAPTVMLEFTVDWRKNHRRIAELIGREKEAQQNFTQLEQKVSYARHLLSDSYGHETISLLRLYPDKIRVQGSSGHPVNELLYTELGLKPGSAVPIKEQVKEFPLTNLAPFETDHLFIFKHYPPRYDEEVLSQLQASPSWCGMHAYRSGRIRIIANWIALSWTPIGQNQIMDELLLPPSVSADLRDQPRLLHEKPSPNETRITSTGFCSPDRCKAGARHTSHGRHSGDGS
ncbi:transcriptional regulator [Paenibacillus mucilaginosus 3016]|uniref:Transcriptional regulator n=2 Tax=Paenibacillus mucilaginosus TaxID=61624 RepID=H6NHB3_9BACL|nr:transcriptional regulator [Paenibacillus mucilaginosus 3016]